MTVSNLLRCTIHWTGYGEEGAIGFYVGGSQASHTSSDLTSAATAVRTTLTGSGKALTRLAGILTTQQRIDKISVYEYASFPGHVTAVGADSTQTAGTGVSLTMGLQMCVVVTLLTPQAGRSRRGRIYLPGYTATPGTSTGLLDSTQTDTYAQLGRDLGVGVRDAIGTTLAISSPQWVVASTVGGFATSIVTARCDNRLDVQRRRANKQVPTYTKSVAA